MADNSSSSDEEGSLGPDLPLPVPPNTRRSLQQRQQRGGSANAGGIATAVAALLSPPSDENDDNDDSNVSASQYSYGSAGGGAAGGAGGGAAGGTAEGQQMKRRASFVPGGALGAQQDVPGALPGGNGSQGRRAKPSVLHSVVSALPRAGGGGHGGGGGSSRAGSDASSSAATSSTMGRGNNTLGKGLRSTFAFKSHAHHSNNMRAGGGSNASGASQPSSAGSGDRDGHGGRGVSGGLGSLGLGSLGGHHRSRYEQAAGQGPGSRSSLDATLAQLESSSGWDSVAAAAALVASEASGGVSSRHRHRYGVGDRVLVSLTVMNATLGGGTSAVASMSMMSSGHHLSPGEDQSLMGESAARERISLLRESTTLVPVNRHGFPPGGAPMGSPPLYHQGPYGYVLATVARVHFEEDAQYYTVTRADTETE